MKPERQAGIQYAALPWRRRGDELEVLLLTSRETRRWVIPKGWPMEGLSPAQCAQQEAYEEGGIRGEPGAAIGTYRYEKWLKDGSARTLTVEVFPLEVKAELILWPEANERDRRWFDGGAAAGLVEESGLAELISAFTGASAPRRT